NEARAPSPRLRMTVPSKICVRSFSPSMTFTCTRTWSPGSNPCRSFLSCAASTMRIASMTFVPLCSRGRRRRLSALEPLDQPPLVGDHLAHPLVHALVASGHQDQVRLARQVGGDRLGERLAARVHQDHP